jgi:hypothetical protein
MSVKRQQPVLITDAAEDPEREVRRREIRYVTMMLVRAGCLIAAAWLVVARPPLWGLWALLCAIAMVLLPWFAVLIANDRPPKKPGEVSAAPPPPVDHAIESAEHRTIDHE